MPSKLSDDDYQRLYCLWAEFRYGITGITKVDFILGHEGPYSPQTPDVTEHLVVTIVHPNAPRNRPWEEKIEDNVFEIIQSINNFIIENATVGIRRAFITLGGDVRKRAPGRHGRPR